MRNLSAFTRARVARGILALVACATLVVPSAVVRANANSAVPGATATEAVGRLTSTGRPMLVDLATAPILRNAPVQPINAVHNNISLAAQFAAKARAAAATATFGKSPNHALLPGPLTTALHGPSFAGINETVYGGFPPDGDIAVGRGAVVHVANFGVTTYGKNGALVKRVNFATFFHNTTDFIFDPRAYWDQYWDRFVVMADGKTGSGSTQQGYIELAISTTYNPSGSYYIYRFAFTPAGDFLDFPQMGADQDAIIFSVNDYLANGGFDAKVFSLSKARMYSGQGTGFSIFGGIGCTVAPPYVLDNNTTSYIMAACPNDNKVYLGALTNSSRTTPSLKLWQALIPVPAYTVPANAPQPGVNYALETGFNEFEQRSIQLGRRIWNVMTVQDGTATPRWYQFDTSSNTLVSDGIWYASATSSDWHPSIVANTYGDVFGTWMSVDAAKNLNLSLHYIGGTGNSAGVGAGSVLHTSTQPLTDQTFPAGRNRAGDYSYIALDPSAYGSCPATRRAWLEGEVTYSANEWGTWLGQIGNC